MKVVIEKRRKTPTFRSGDIRRTFLLVIRSFVLYYPQFDWTITTQACDGMVAEKVQRGAIYQRNISGCTG